jgi:hypothetical protein
MKTDQKVTITAIAAIVIFVLAARVLTMTVLGHPVSFAPMNALALFCGAYLGKRSAAYILPLAAIFISDAVINSMFYGSLAPLYPGWYWQYLCYVLFVAIGAWYQPNRAAANVALAGLSITLLFFLISNFGTWFSTTLYPPTYSGLVQCMVMGLPFLKTAVIADLFFCSLFFGSYELMRRSRKEKLAHA